MTSSFRRHRASSPEALRERIRRGARRAYVVRSLESAPSRVPAKTPPAGWAPPEPTEADRALVRALLAAKKRGTTTDTTEAA